MLDRLERRQGATTNTRGLALGAVVGFLLVAIARETATPIAYVGGVVVAGVFLVGLAAALGGVAGLVIHDLFQGAIGYWTPVTAVWILVCGAVVTWLVGGRHGLNDASRGSLSRRVVATAGVVTLAGVYATAVAAWLAMLLGGERFYTAAFEFLPGVAVAVGASFLVVIAVAVTRRFDRLPERESGPASPESGEQRPDSTAGPSVAATLGVFAIGSAWLGGAIALDLLVHDLGLFATASEFHAYLIGFLGSGSPMSTVGTTLLVGLYQYGHVAVLLSALLAVLAVIGWNWYRPQILSATVDRENIPVGEPTDD